MATQVIYAIDDDGTMNWYAHVMHDDGTHQLDGPHAIGSGWRFDHVLAGEQGAIYGLDRPRLDPVTGGTIGGQVRWYRHRDWTDGGRAWEPGTSRPVAHGWEYRHVVGSSGGVVYAVEPTGLDPVTGRRTGGRLRWNRHDGWSDGSVVWAQEASAVVGRDWDFPWVFCGAEGVVYAVDGDGDLLWYRHNGRLDGTFDWAPNSSATIGAGWDFEHLAAGADGSIYAVTHDRLNPVTGGTTGGNLIWYRHDGWRDGTAAWANGGQGVTLTQGWDGKRAVMAVAATTSTPTVSATPCGFEPLAPSPGGLRPNNWGVSPSRWNRSTLTYRIENAAPGLDGAATAVAIQAAFGAWSAASSFVFQPVTARPDLTIEFGGDDLDNRFGRRGGVMGSAAYPPEGTIRFDAAETWTDNTLTQVAVHEIGHALGLPHSDSSGSVMHPSQWPGTFVDNETRDYLRSIYDWVPQQSVGPDRGSTEGPSLAVATAADGTLNLFAMWRGIEGDDGLWWSRLDGARWSPQRPVPGMGSQHGPAIAAGLGDGATGLVMVCDGIPGDQSIWYSTNPDPLAGEWTTQQQVPNCFTSARPAIAAFGGRLWMAWKGPDDSTLWWSTFDGRWAAPMPIERVGTGDAPALAVAGGRLFLACKGIDGDDALYVSSIAPGSTLWDGFVPITYRQVTARSVFFETMMSSRGPTLTSHDGDLALACRGVGDNNTVYVASWIVDRWTGPVGLSDAATSAVPSLASFGGRLHMAWKGNQDDTGLWHSSRL